MPWCEECAKYRAPSAMTPDARCPTCGNPIDVPDPRGTGATADADAKAPWHFKLMLVALIAYLAWRFVDLFT